MGLNKCLEIIHKLLGYNPLISLLITKTKLMLVILWENVSILVTKKKISMIKRKIRIQGLYNSQKISVILEIYKIINVIENIFK